MQPQDIFRAGAEAMQRVLAEVLRDHLNSRAAAIANSTPLPVYEEEACISTQCATTEITPAASGEIPGGMVEEQDWMQMARDAAASVRPNSPWAGRVHDGMRDDGDEVRSAMAAIAAVCAITTSKASAETGGANTQLTITVSSDGSTSFHSSIPLGQSWQATHDAMAIGLREFQRQFDESDRCPMKALSAAPSAPATETGEDA